jgi:poly-gamma-glutamate synthesis protein (capsule biosynthesis protein)
VAQPEILLDTRDVPNASEQGTWTYAVAAPFFTIEEAITSQDLMLAWSGVSTGTLTNQPMLVTTSTLRTLEERWGPSSGGIFQTVSAAEMLTVAQQSAAWALLPFHALTPRWKVLRIDGLSLIEKGLPQGTYPLEVPLTLGSASRPDALNLLPVTPDTLTNRREDAMTLVAMTGVTALTRGTARLMDTKGITYPGIHIRDWLTTADFVHISNEVSFKPDCIAGPSGTMSFCSHDNYIQLLEYVGANIIELTGNHLADKGPQWISHSLAMYQARGWHWFGGGATITEATRPLTLTHGPNAIAFLGCNPIGPAYDLATEGRPGSAPCDYERMQDQVRQLRAAGYNPIVTLQYLEAYEYAPTPQQIRDFRAFAEAGATMVQGSQAHQAQTMEFYRDTFIHYGLGNFFFDQMWSAGTRQEFVDRLTFYNGRLLSIDLRPAILEEYGQPRPMTDDYPDPAGRRPEFLQMIFALSP